MLKIKQISITAKSKKLPICPPIRDGTEANWQNSPVAKKAKLPDCPPKCDGKGENWKDVPAAKKATENLPSN